MSTAYVEDSEAGSSDSGEGREDDYSFCVYYSEVPKERAIKVGMQIEGKNVDLVLDTGSPVTILPEHLVDSTQLEQVS